MTKGLSIYVTDLLFCLFAFLLVPIKSAKLLL